VDRDGIVISRFDGYFDVRRIYAEGDCEQSLCFRNRERRRRRRDHSDEALSGRFNARGPFRKGKKSYVRA
jgi:hypothetical protein